MVRYNLGVEFIWVNSDQSLSVLRKFVVGVDCEWAPFEEMTKMLNSHVHGQEFAAESTIALLSWCQFR